MSDRELNGEPRTLSPVERIAFIIWLRYTVTTEAFDRKLPGAWRHGEWIPFDPTSSRVFARPYLKIAEREIQDHNLQAITISRADLVIDAALVKRVREEISRMTYDRQREELVRLTGGGR